MGELEGRLDGQFDWEDSSARAWAAFQARLSERLAGMEDDDLLLLEAESSPDSSGAAPYVHVCGWGRGELRCEAVSNRHLAPLHRLDDAAQAALVELGFSRPTSTSEGGSGSSNFWADAPTDDVDRIAAMVVRALRDVYGVAHPAFLTGDPLVEERSVVDELEELHVQGEEPATYPVDGPEHLQRLVDEALTPFFGEAPEHDEDGDIPVVCGDVTAFVTVIRDRPVVRLFACLLSSVADHARADFEVGVVNRDTPFLKLFRRGDAVFVQTDLVAWPFAPDHLRHLVQRMCRDVGQIRDDLSRRLEAGDAESAHPAMLTLLHLEAQQPGSVDAMLAASICEHDRDVVLELLTWTARQETAWRQSRDEALTDGDDDLVEVSQAELEQARRMTALLQGALRVVVERRAAGVEHPRSRHRQSVGGGRGRGRDLPSQRRVPDPTLEEVDPEMWG